MRAGQRRDRLAAGSDRQDREGGARAASPASRARRRVRRIGRHERGHCPHQARDCPDQTAAPIRPAAEQASAELDHIVEQTEKATSDILQAAEEIQEVAWILRERGTDIELCDKIDQRATDIYTACSFQDITGQRTEKVVKALRFIEQRINAMIEIWGVDDIAFKVDDIAAKMKSFAATVRDDRLLNGPTVKGDGLKQEDVDRLMTGLETWAQAAVSAATASLRHSEEPPPSSAPEPARAESGGFDQPEPLTLGALNPIKRAVLFG
jgi:chemotaxis regulatin CheY-phosphate phosphatase CheZ